MKFQSSDLLICFLILLYQRDDDSDSGTRISKASPEAQKPTGFLKVLRNSLKKKEKIPEEELSRKG